MNPFASKPSETIASLGESALIEELRNWLGAASPATPYGIGDDCAVLLPSSTGSQQLVTADPVIYGKHFDDSLTPEQTAAKLLRRNLSDIAAMGGRPTHALIALALSPNVSIQWIEAFYKALGDEALQFQTKIVGGDLSSSDSFLGAFLTLSGEIEKDCQPLLRKTASLGSPIFVTGELGGTRLQKHHAFTPRLAEGQWLARSGHCSSCTDLSDGLGKDFTNITPPGLSCLIDCDSLPISTEAIQTSKSSEKTPLYHVFNDGEDFELLFTLHPDTDLTKFASDWKQSFTTPLSQIGRIERGPEPLVLKNSPPDLIVNGYEHLR